MRIGHHCRLLTLSVDDSIHAFEFGGGLEFSRVGRHDCYGFIEFFYDSPRGHLDSLARPNLGVPFWGQPFFSTRGRTYSNHTRFHLVLERLQCTPFSVPSDVISGRYLVSPSRRNSRSGQDLTLILFSPSFSICLVVICDDADSADVQAL